MAPRAVSFILHPSLVYCSGLDGGGVESATFTQLTEQLGPFASREVDVTPLMESLASIPCASENVITRKR